MLFSAFLALSFTPALCATLLRPGHLNRTWSSAAFNRAFEWSLAAYMRRVYQSVRHRAALDDRLRAAGRGGARLFVRHAGGLPARGGPGYAYMIVQTPPGHPRGSHHAGHDARRARSCIKAPTWMR